MRVPNLKVLIVEDQFLIAKQLEILIESAGHTIVGTATSRETACKMADETQPDIVLLDISLADGPTGLDIAEYLSSVSKAEVVFTTANKRRVPDDFCGALGVIEKPFTRLGLLSAIDYIFANLSDRLQVPEKPNSLVLSPDYRMRWCEETVQ